MSGDPDDRSPVLILGGGVAALESLLALRELGEGELPITLVAPEREFTYRPLLVREPFSPAPADRVSLPAAMQELGAEFVEGRLTAVDADRRLARLEDGSELRFGDLVVCIGARMRPALEAAHTLWVGPHATPVDLILDQVSEAGRLNLIVPPGVTWTLPLYEYALMTQRRLRERGIDGVEMTVVTPEEQPLVVFGAQASAAVREMLELRGIGVATDTWVTETADGSLVAAGGEPNLAGVAVALPVMEGIPVEGLPADGHGFVPTDRHGRVDGLDHVYAAGDGTSFPIKQGGIATQQADAAAESIAAERGFAIEPSPFRPVLRGKLLTGAESLHLRTELAGGAGEGAVSSDYLWWPPHKVSGRFLAPWLAGESLAAQEPPPGRSVDVEASLPHEWHGDPLGLGSYRFDPT